MTTYSIACMTLSFPKSVPNARQVLRHLLVWSQYLLKRGKQTLRKRENFSYQCQTPVTNNSSCSKSSFIKILFEISKILIFHFYYFYVWLTLFRFLLLLFLSQFMFPIPIKETICFQIKHTHNQLKDWKSFW